MRIAVLTVAALLTACSSSADLPPGFPCPDRAAASPADLLLPAPPPPVAKLRLTMNPADVHALYSRDPRSDDRLPGNAAIDGGDTVPLRGLRFRGSTSRHLPKKSFNIRFEEPQALLFGSTRMNANAMYTDPAMMRERLAFDMFHHLQQPAPRTRYVDLYLNGIFEGLYLHIERVDESLLGNAGLNPDGTLVRDGFRSARGADPRINRDSAFGFSLSRVSGGQREALLAEAFDSRGAPDWSALAELILWVERARPGGNFERQFRQRFDAGNFIDWLAVHYLIGDFDSFADDYWLYLDHHDPGARWHVIPWDKDLSFGSHWRPGFFVANDYFSYERPVQSEWGNRLIELVLSTAGLRSEIGCRMLELMEDVFPPEWFEHAIDQIDAEIHASVSVQPEHGNAFVRHPNNHFSFHGMQHRHNDALRDFVELRYAFLRRQIDPPDDEEYTAEIDLDGAGSGDTLLLTDPGGWTIARLVPTAPPVSPGRLHAQVVHDPTVDGIDREWIFHNTGNAFDAELSLYYRNDLPGIIVPRTDNWVTLHSSPVHWQWRLRIAGRTDDGFTVLPGFHVNPFSNKVRATVTFPAGETRLNIIDIE